jgi:hypothetical protein
LAVVVVDHLVMAAAVVVVADVQLALCLLVGQVVVAPRLGFTAPLRWVQLLL